MSSAPTFTVFTPTHNRAHTLHRVYNSLCAQTFHCFEWLVIDDGSTDATARLIADWQREAAFPIRYLWQENQGKHVAYNRALLETCGEYFLPLDSDDACVPRALERLLDVWNEIPLEDRARFAGVTARCMTPASALVGLLLPRSPLDATATDAYFRRRMRWESWQMFPTKIARQYPFPAVRSGNTHIPEGIIWLRMGLQYYTRFIDEPLRIYYSGDDTLTNRMGQGHVYLRRSAGGHAAFHLFVLNECSAYLRYAPLLFLRSAVHFVRFSLLDGRGLVQQAQSLETAQARALWLLGLPMGWLLYRSSSAARRSTEI